MAPDSNGGSHQGGATNPMEKGYGSLWAKIQEASKEIEADEAFNTAFPYGRELSAPELIGPSPLYGETPEHGGHVGLGSSVNRPMPMRTAPHKVHFRDEVNGALASPTPAARGNAMERLMAGFGANGTKEEAQVNGNINGNVNGNVNGTGNGYESAHSEKEMNIKEDASAQDTKPMVPASKMTAFAAEFRPCGNSAAFWQQPSTGFYPQYNAPRAMNTSQRLGQAVPDTASFKSPVQGPFGYPGLPMAHDASGNMMPPPPPPAPSSIGLSSPPMHTTRQFPPSASMPSILTQIPEVRNSGIIPAPSAGSVPGSKLPFHDPSILQVLNGPTGNLKRLELSPVRAPQSKELTALLQNTSLENVMGEKYFPFVETAALGGQAVDWGVIKLTNIPFDAARNEIDAMLGRNCHMVDDKYEPIHIITCRITGKTLDAYVEFRTLQDATKAVERHIKNCKAGKPSRIRDRDVGVGVSSQEDLMRCMFPRASGVTWQGNVPVIDTRPGMFRGFITEEELTLVRKNIINPHRTPFSKDAPERAYEFLISTLKKFPWNQTEHIKLRNQYDLFKTAFRMVERLKYRVARSDARDARADEKQPRLSVVLLKRLATAICVCPGFTAYQKSSVADLINMEPQRRRDLGLPNRGDLWLHQYATGVKMGVPLDIIDWYINIVAEETKKLLLTMPVQTQEKIRHMKNHDHWGFFWYFVGYHRGGIDNITLHEAATKEFGVIDQMLRQAFATQQQQLQQCPPAQLTH